MNKIRIQSLPQQESLLPSRAFFGRDSKAGGGAGKLHSEHREGFRCALIGGSWQATGGLTKRGACSVIGLGSIFCFF